MGTFHRIRLEVEVTFGEVGVEPPKPDSLAELIETLIMLQGGLDIEVVVVGVEELG